MVRDSGVRGVGSNRSQRSIVASPATTPAGATPDLQQERVDRELKPTPSQTTAQKIEEFYGVKQLDGEVVFSARFETAKHVLIAGDFNNWSPMSTPMQTNGRPGVWTMKLPLAPGRYRYRLVVDGKWITDPHNQYVEANQFGELNNVIDVD